jgi:hypothetical protein
MGAAFTKLSMGHSHSTTRKPEPAISESEDYEEEYFVVEEIAKFSFLGVPK